MRAVTGVLRRLFGRKYRLTCLERRALDAIGSKLSASLLGIWDRQIDAIHLCQRLTGGIGVCFYMREPEGGEGATSFRFQRNDEFIVATVAIALPELDSSITADVWMVSGRLFSIEYKGSINYFDEAMGMDPEPQVVLTVAMSTVGLI